jgi:anti-anti-sigma regulatory factor
MELKEGHGRLEVDLPAVLDLPLAADLRDTLLDALSRDIAADVVLKAALVERISTAAIQVILAAAAGFGMAARRLEVETPSQAFASAFAQLGLTAELEKII